MGSLFSSEPADSIQTDKKAITKKIKTKEIPEPKEVPTFVPIVSAYEGSVYKSPENPKEYRFIATYENNLQLKRNEVVLVRKGPKNKNNLVYFRREPQEVLDQPPQPYVESIFAAPS